MSDAMAKKQRMLSFRASEEEIELMDRLTEKAMEQYPFMNKSAVLRELVGLSNFGFFLALRSAVLRKTPASLKLPQPQAAEPVLPPDPYEGGTFPDDVPEYDDAPLER